ncbi:MAG: hypothetical protein H6598_09915 [Flavobacteriales bacterium]|nr:hypothetical protein [Flavobacteriales bacterium]
MEIKLGIGVNNIKFGMDRSEVKQILGEPTEKELFSYSEEDEDLTEVWHYDEYDFSLSFDEADNWKLIMIAASEEDCNLNEKEIIGLEFDKVVAILKDMGYTDLEEDELEEGDRVIKIEKDSFNVWFDDNIATELQWGPRWDDDDTPIFP